MKERHLFVFQQLSNKTELNTALIPFCLRNSLYFQKKSSKLGGVLDISVKEEGRVYFLVTSCSKENVFINDLKYSIYQFTSNSSFQGVVLPFSWPTCALYYRIQISWVVKLANSRVPDLSQCQFVFKFICFFRLISEETRMNQNFRSMETPVLGCLVKITFFGLSLFQRFFGDFKDLYRITVTVNYSENPN